VPPPPAARSLRRSAASRPGHVERQAPVEPAELRVRPARPGETARTARLHERSLPDGFFARLGTSFLARYHASFLTSSRARLLVAERGGRVVGFLAGTVDNAAHYRRVVQARPVGLLLAGIVSLLRRPRLAAEFLRTRTGRYVRALLRQVAPSSADEATTSDAAGGPVAEPVAVLTHVAVSSDERGSGAGRALVGAFTEELAREGVEEVRLITAVDGGAPRFYRRLGWRSRGRRRAADGTVVEEFARRP
jgi:ribosomal protein S18 acetylase RimI-like enzyme